MIEILKQVEIFDGIDEINLLPLIKSLDITKKQYKKNEYVTLIGDEISSIGVILNGNIQIIKEDLYGNKNIIAGLSKTDIFAETFACASISKSPVSVISITDSDIMFINFKKVLGECSLQCGSHSKLISNMLALLANKNLLLNKKIEIISKRTMQQKILAFCSANKTPESNIISVPFNRNELADYLCVDRSALSRELGRLQDEGILKVDGNKFEILIYN